MIKPPSQAPFAPLPSGLVQPSAFSLHVSAFKFPPFSIDGTLLPQSRAALRVTLSRDLPHPICTRLLCLGLSRGPRPSDCFAGFIVHPCTRCSQGSPFGSTFGGYNSTFPRSRFSGLVHPSPFRLPFPPSSFFIFHFSLCHSACSAGESFPGRLPRRGV
jgi:hypothetical protein